MFSNRFNTRNDPLLEAVQNAMQDGETRRQATEIVNEAFGVYNRNAVVREELADYDAAIEEAYADLKEGVQIDEISKGLAKRYIKKSEKDQDKMDLPDTDSRDYIKGMRKFDNRSEGQMRAKDKLYKTKDGYTGKPYAKVFAKEELADKDYDKDGKIESPKDEVWGSRLRAAKLAGKLKEEQIDEKRTSDRYVSTVKHGDAADDKKMAAIKDAVRGYNKAKGTKVRIDRAGRLGKDNPNASKYGKVPGWLGNTKLNRSKIRQGDAASSDVYLRGKNDYSKGDFGHAENKEHIRKIKKGIANKFKKAMEESHQMDEAAYSAKAARAGKDIGKPGKMFSKIAKKAGERYGSEERGRKVAGAILKRIRAKHMKEENLEELSAFGREFAAARKAGQSQFMSKVTGKMTTTALKSPTTAKPTQWKSPSAPDQAATIKASGGTPSVQTGTAAPKTAPLPPSRPSGLGDVPTISAPSTPVKKFTPSPAQQQAASDAKFMRTGGGAPQGPTTTGSTGAKFAGTDAVSAPAGSAADVYGSRSVGGPKSSIPSGPSGERSTGQANITAPAPTAPKVPVTKPLMKESVQVGANKYRIV